MSATDKRIDAYITASADFAKPILTHLRKTIHEACPEVKETWKWSFPHFEYAGSILCSMASFKQHCSFGFWLGAKMKDPHQLLSVVGEKTAMGHFGQIKSIKDLPSKKILVQYIKEAMGLIDEGVKLTKPKNDSPKKLVVPDYLITALKKNKKAFKTFDDFTYSHKKEYVEWITEAKTDATRDKRIATAIEWLSEGKSRNWKYTKS